MAFLLTVALAGSLSGSIGSIDNSTFTYNSTLGFGAGINNQGSAANIFNTTFSYNLNCTPIPGAGECAQGDPTTAGGAIYNDASALLLQVTQCTFYGNRALQGAAIYNEAPYVIPTISMFDDIPVETAGVYIDNSTISGNVANLGGGGIYNVGFINNFLSNIVAGNIDTNEYSLAAPDLFSVKYSVTPINAGAEMNI